MFNLFRSSNAYFTKVYKNLRNDLLRYKFAYYFLRILTLLLSFGISIFTVLILSDLIWDGWPPSYIFISTGVSVVTAFSTSIINFFFIKEQIDIKTKQLIEMDKERFKYKNKIGKFYKDEKNKDFNFYLVTSSILGNKKSLSELKHE